MKKIFMEEGQKINQAIRRREKMNMSLPVFPKKKGKKRYKEEHVEVLDLMEKWRKTKEIKAKEKEIQNATPLLYFAKTLEQTCTSNVVFSGGRHHGSFGSLLKKSINDIAIVPDESFKEILQIDQSNFSRIPIKEELTSLNNRFGEIFITDLASASNITLLKRYDIKSVLSLSHSNQPTRYSFLEGKYSVVHIADYEKGPQNLTESIQAIFRIIERCLSEGNLLINCFYGVSRSCAVVASYLMKKYQVNLSKAITIVRKGRKSLKISDHLLKELVDLESKLFRKKRNSDLIRIKIM